MEQLDDVVTPGMEIFWAQMTAREKKKTFSTSI